MPTPIAPRRTRLLQLVAEPAVTDAAALERALEGALAAARARWPEVALDDAAYLEALARRLGPRASLPKELERLHLEDLFLATACAHGLGPAIAAFEQQFFPIVDAEAARLRVPSESEEVRQLLRRNFFVGRDEARPAILQYSGDGPLGGWVRVSVVRELLKLRKAQDRETPSGEEALGDVLSAEVDPELTHLKGLYRQEFSEAFRATLHRLQARERTLLKQHFLDGLSIDELGRLYQVHRSTAARWLVKLREEVLEKTRDELVVRLKVSTTELDSIMRLIGSRLDASLRLLGEP